MPHSDKLQSVAKRLAAVSDCPEFEARWMLAADNGDVEQMITRRLAGEPLQYILGEWEFYSLPFAVGEGVLIPRPDTEILVDTALDFLAGKSSADCIDLCAGSGCVGIAVAKNCPGVRISALEKSDKAYEFLCRNIRLNNASVTPIKGDVTARGSGRYDLILSNPPYIKTEVLATLGREVQKEPRQALDGGPDGLYFYRAILDNWLCCLKKGGMLAVEIGFDQADEVKALFLAAGLKNIGVKRDFGNNQRVVFGTLDDI